jgi:hypothetical protein
MSTYRDQELAQLETVRRNRDQAVTRFFDGSLSLDERLQAALSAGTFAGDAELAKATAIVRDENENTLLRATALNGLSNRLIKDEDFLKEVIQLLGNESAPADLRRVAMTALQGSQFGSQPMMVHQRPNYKNVLRGLVDDADPELRQYAAELLALDRDEYVQRRLLGGLQDPSQAIVAPEVAIQYLAHDLHADMLPVLRHIARNPPNEAAKKEALRNLTLDPESKDLLVERLTDPQESPEIRHVCAVALYQMDPALMRKLARDIVADDGTDDELRAALLNTMSHLPAGSAAPEADDGFGARVAELEATTTSAPLKRMAEEYRKRSQS